MVLEGDGVLVPSRLVLGDVHAYEVSEPDDVGDLKLLKLEVGVEDSEVEAVLESHGESAGLLGSEHVVDLVFAVKSFVAVVLIEVGSLEDGLVVGAFKGLHKLLRVSALVDGGHEVGVKVTQVGDELSSGGLTATSITDIFNGERVVDDLDGSHIALKLKEVVHAGGGGLTKVGGAPLVELLNPNLFDTELDLVEAVVLHDLDDGVEVRFLSLVLTDRFHLLLKELSEVNSDRQVDKDVLVEVEVIVSLNRLDGLELLKVTERVSTLEQLLGRASTLEALDHVDDVVDLVAVEHLGEEGVEGVGGVPDQVDNLTVELLLHGSPELLDLEGTSLLPGEDVVAVVSVLESEFELSEVADGTERLVVLLSKHALAERTHEGLGVGVIDVV